MRTAPQQHGERIMGAAGLAPTAEVAALLTHTDRCGTCAFWAEDHCNAPGGLCIASRSPLYKKDRRALAEACRRYIRARFLHVAELLEAFGLWQVGMPHIRHLEGKLWEMRLRPAATASPAPSISRAPGIG